MTESYDALVLGVGGVGSAALFHLASRGLRVLGIDRFAPGHDRGSSHGQTRLIRQAYFEHPAYVPLVQRAYALWSELEQRSGQSLYREVGILEAGPPGGIIVPGVLASARQHQLPVEQLDAAQLKRRFPGFEVPDDYSAVFEARAGYLRVEDCVRAHISEAINCGARLLIGPAVRGWQREGTGFRVVTDDGEFLAGHLVISAGAWARDLLTGLGISLQVVRKSLYWFRSSERVYEVDQGAPGFIFETPGGEYFGFPALPATGLKCAEHSGGIPVNDPLQVDRRPIQEETERVQRFMTRCLPLASTAVQDFAVCLYTLSPDRNFIVDVHPDAPRASFAAGLSGHGFKFTSVLGEILADLALQGKSPLPVQFMSVGRFAK